LTFPSVKTKWSAHEALFALTPALTQKIGERLFAANRLHAAAFKVIAEPIVLHAKMCVGE